MAKQYSGKFRAMAESMQKQIDAKLDPAVGRQRMTHRRAAMASRSNEEGMRLLGVQGRLMALAEAIEEGRVPESLIGLTSKPQVERLFRYERFPSVLLHNTTMKDIGSLVQGIEEARALFTTLPAGDPEESGITLSPEQTVILDRVIAAIKKAGRSSYWINSLIDDLNEYRRMKDAGIENEEQYTSARSDLLGLPRAGSLAKVEAVSNAVKVRKIARSLIGMNIPGYFPTPAIVATELVREAGIEEGMSILEPSAGKGDLLYAIGKECRDKGLREVTIDAIEINGTLCQVLEAKDYKVTQGDFLEIPLARYDRIIMNPPFENGQEMEHVRRAYELLNPGGRVAAIMSEGPFFRNDRKAVDFRNWLDINGGQTGRNEAGVFNKSDRPTGVSTRIVILRKDDGISPEQKPELSTMGMGL